MDQNRGNFMNTTQILGSTQGFQKHQPDPDFCSSYAEQSETLSTAACHTLYASIDPILPNVNAPAAWG